MTLRLNTFIKQKVNRHTKFYSTKKFVERSLEVQPYKISYEQRIINDKINKIISKGRQNCIFSSYSFNNSKFPLSSVINYEIDFDGKPFFSINLNDNLMIGQYANIKKTSTCSINIYDINEEYSYFGDGKIREYNNLILYGFVKQVYKLSDLQRLWWIIDKSEEEYDKNFSYIFKLDKIDQIELINNKETGPNKDVRMINNNNLHIDHSVFTFVDPHNYNESFNFNSKIVKHYLMENFRLEIYRMTSKYSDNKNVPFLDIEEITSRYILIRVTDFDSRDIKNNKSRMLRDLTYDVKIEFEKKLININCLESFLNNFKEKDLDHSI